MPSTLDVSGLRALLHARDDRLRTCSLYTTRDGLVPARDGLPVGVLFPKRSGYRRHYRERQAGLPRLVHAERCTDRLRLPEEPVGLIVEEAWVVAFRMPFGNAVLGIVLALTAPRHLTGRIAPLVVQLDAGRDEIRLDGDVWYHRVAGVPRLGLDFHHLTFLAPGMLPRTAQLDTERLMRMVSRRSDPSRADFRTIRLPAEANRYRDMACAITPGASIVAGHAADAQLAMTLSAVQALASLSTLRSVQHETQATVTELLADGRDDRWLVERTEALARLELQLSFGVEANLAMRLFVPSLPIEQFHAELLGALGIDDALRVTDRMLSRLTAALAAERASVESARAERDERRWRRWSAVGGTVAVIAVPITLVTGFLGINASQVKEDVSAFDLRAYGVYYAVLVVVMLVSVAIAAVWAQPRRKATRRD